MTNTIHKILLLGSNGQVGYELSKNLFTLGQIISLDFPEIDFTDLKTLQLKIEEIKPTIIVNAAAYTAVDAAESNSDLAYKINSDAPQILANYAALHDIPMVHYSTDYVFDGTKNTPYEETETPNPLNIYGTSKLKGDLSISNTCKQFIIFRTSWVYGVRGNNFFLKILNLAKEKDELNIVGDQIGSPTSSRFIAQVTTLVLHQYLSLPLDERKTLSGVYNCVTNGETSWYGFAKYFLELDPKKSTQTIKRINETESKNLPPSAAARPKYSKLSVKKLERSFRLRIPKWQELLLIELNELKQTSAST